MHIPGDKLLPRDRDNQPHQRIVYTSLVDVMPATRKFLVSYFPVNRETDPPSAAAGGRGDPF
jgi:hypothetical protein